MFDQTTFFSSLEKKKKVLRDVCFSPLPQRIVVFYQFQLYILAFCPFSLCLFSKSLHAAVSGSDKQEQNKQLP